MKVISKGKTYRVECPHCGAVLEYTARDISEYATIKCPCCNETINHTKDNEYIE